MNDRNWKGAFGPTPDAFKRNISFAIHKVKEEQSVKKIKAATVLAISMIILLMAAVAYAAATQWGLNSFNQKMPPEAQGALQTNLPQTGGEEADVRVKVREVLYDGQQLHVIVEVRPKEPDKVLLMAFDSVPEDVVLNGGPVYANDQRTYAQVAKEEGRRLMNVNFHIEEAEEQAADSVLEEDGTLVAYLSSPLHVQGASIPLTCGYVIQKYDQGKPLPPEQSIRGKIGFDVTASTNKKTHLYSGPIAIEKTGVTVDKIMLTQTDAGVYAELTFSVLPEASKAEKELAENGLWFEYLDEKGQRIGGGTTGRGGIDRLTLADGTKSDTAFVQTESLDLLTLPDSLTVRGYDRWEQTRFGQHTFAAER